MNEQMLITILAVATAVLLTILYFYNIAFTNLCENYCGLMNEKGSVERPLTCTCHPKIEVLHT